MGYIAIKDYIKGNTAISYDDGVKCKQDIEKILNNEENVVIDFSDVEFVIAAFLNPIIGDLILELGVDVMKRIEIKEANRATLKKIKMVKDGVLLKREDIEE